MSAWCSTMSFCDTGYWLTLEETVVLDLCFANTTEGLLSRQTLGNFTGALPDVIGLLCVFPTFLGYWSCGRQRSKVWLCLNCPKVRAKFSRKSPLKVKCSMLTLHWKKASNRRRAGHWDRHRSIFSHFSKILQRTFVLADIGSMQRSTEGTVTDLSLLALPRRQEKAQMCNRSWNDSE